MLLVARVPVQVAGQLDILLSCGSVSQLLHLEVKQCSRVQRVKLSALSVV